MDFLERLPGQVGEEPVIEDYHHAVKRLFDLANEHGLRIVYRAPEELPPEECSELGLLVLVAPTGLTAAISLDRIAPHLIMLAREEQRARLRGAVYQAGQRIGELLADALLNIDKINGGKRYGYEKHL